MYATFRVVSPGPDKDRWFSLLDGQTLVLGRGPASNVFLSDAKASRVHCVVHVQGAETTLADCNSTWGTWVNGKRVSECKLRPGDRIKIGDTEIEFGWTDADEVRTEWRLVLPPSDKAEGGDPPVPG